jgi:hypothetical protein
MTPVEVSLCAQAYASTPRCAGGRASEPGSALATSGGCRNGASATPEANFAENSP